MVGHQPLNPLLTLGILDLRYLVFFVTFVFPLTACTQRNDVGSIMEIAIGDSLADARAWAINFGMVPVEFTPSLAWANGDPPKEFLESQLVSFEKQIDTKTVTVTFQIFNGKVWRIHRFKKEVDAKFGYPEHTILETISTGVLEKT